MTIMQTRSAIPAPRTAESSKRLTGDASQTAAYLEFLFGFGAAPGLDLGTPLAYTRIPTQAGPVYRQDFERGVAVANLGEETTEVTFEHPYYDLNHTPRTSVTVAAHSVEVLLNDPA